MLRENSTGSIAEGAGRRQRPAMGKSYKTARYSKITGDPTRCVQVDLERA